MSEYEMYSSKEPPPSVESVRRTIEYSLHGQDKAENRNDFRDLCEANQIEVDPIAERTFSYLGYEVMCDVEVDLLTGENTFLDFYCDGITYRPTTNKEGAE